MVTDLRSYIPKPNNWFSSRIQYKGRGTAEFLDPKGWAAGKATATFEENGKYRIELVIDTYESEQPLKHGLVELLKGHPAHSHGSNFAMWSDRMKNTCTALQIETSEGIFYAGDQIEQYQHFLDHREHLIFFISYGEFVTKNEEQAKYWVMPLVNFISEFHGGHPIFDNHPLRIHPIPKYPDNLEHEERQRADLDTHYIRKRMVSFLFKERPGFIEPLPNYVRLAKKLEDGKVKSLITAVMVSELEDENIETAEVEKWFPFRFLRLLSLATGTKVGTPWIEFRDKEGKQVRRLHLTRSQPQFTKGEKAIHEIVHGGTGHLLTCAQEVDCFEERYFNVVIEMLVRAGEVGLSTEEKLNDLFIALDSLCKEWGCYIRFNPRKELDEGQLQVIDTAIKTAIEEIEEVRNTAQISKNIIHEIVLQRIESRIKNATGPIEVSFGNAVISLLHKLELVDAEVLEKHFGNSRAWAELLTQKRNRVIHNAFFELDEREKDIDELYKLYKHLHDILLRIILKSLKYEGTYQPTILSKNRDETVDWVTPDTPASELGYSER